MGRWDAVAGSGGVIGVGERGGRGEEERKGDGEGEEGLHLGGLAVLGVCCAFVNGG